MSVSFASYAQCSTTGISISSSSETSVNLYTPSFFLLPSGADNIYEWTITDESGGLVHQETIAQGTDFANSFMQFNHSVPITESMDACLKITNATSGLTCNVCDVLFWKIDPAFGFGSWEVLNNSVGVLPVSLVDFKGEVHQNQVELNWQTASENNNLGFEVERSTNGEDWERIDFVEGEGTSTEIVTYNSFDKQPVTGVNYYRLKQLDFDRQYEYSEVIGLEIKGEATPMQVFPNPSHGPVQIAIENPLGEEIVAQLVDVQGRVVWQGGSAAGEGVWRETVLIEESGLYFLTLQLGGETQQQKVLVERS